MYPLVKTRNRLAKIQTLFSENSNPFGQDTDQRDSKKERESVRKRKIDR